MRFTTCQNVLSAGVAAALLAIVPSAGWGAVARQHRGRRDRPDRGHPDTGGKVAVLNTNLSALTNQEGRDTIARVPAGT